MGMVSPGHFECRVRNAECKIGVPYPGLLSCCPLRGAFGPSPKGASYAVGESSLVVKETFAKSGFAQEFSWSWDNKARPHPGPLPQERVTSSVRKIGFL